jgi:hypothetical protein
MKLKHLYVLVATVLLWTLYNSNSTGAGSANFNCSNCHNGSTTTTKIDSVILRDVANLEKMVKYSPSTPYIITIYGSNSGSLNRFGFQMSHGGKGSFSNPSADCQLSGNIWEHKQKISGTSGKFQVSARWNAPVKGTGTVTLEAYLNAVDNDNSTSGDKPSTKFTYTFDELTTADLAQVEIRIISPTFLDNKNPNETLTFKAFPTNGGSTPEYQWKLNSKNIGPKGFEDTYISSTLRNNDTVTCWMYSSQFGALPNPAYSNKIIRVVFNSNNTGSIAQTKSSNPFLTSAQNKLFKLLNTNELANVKLFNLQGIKLLENRIFPSELLDLSLLPRGIYLVKIQINNTIYSQKIALD